MRRREKIVLAATAVSAVIAFAAMLSHFTAARKPSSLETTLANMAKDVVIPIEAENLENPLPATNKVLNLGERLYSQDCALCHAADGHGRTTIGRGMYPPAMDLTSPHAQHWKDAELFWIVQNGVPLTGMPSWKATLTASDTWEIVDFMRNLPRLDAERRAGQNAGSPGASPSESKERLIRYGKILYRQEGCFMCHRLGGQGGRVGPDLSVEGTRGRSEAWLVGHFKNPSAYTPGSIMPSFKNLTDEQLQALTIFLMDEKAQKSIEHEHARR